MKFKEPVFITDSLSIGVGRGACKASIDQYQKPIIQIEGWVSLCLRERGKIKQGSRFEGKNIWTNAGREYLALRQTIDPSAAPKASYRVDYVGYVGVGTGSQVEQANVLQLVTPVAYAGADFLAPIDSASFPLTPSKTTVEYYRLFAENEITTTPGSQVDISELGLFTDGDPATLRASGARDVTLANAVNQVPVAYKTFEPIRKTDGLELELFWQIRY